MGGSGGGGGGGGGYSGGGGDYPRKLDDAHRRQQDTLNAQVDQYLGGVLSSANDHDSQLIGERLDGILNSLKDTAEVEKLQFGGSMAKQTAVDGVSDVDALVILNKEAAAGITPKEFVKDFADKLRTDGKIGQVVSITPGQLAVTVRYADGTEIQLLPALRRGDQVLIGKPDGTGWQATEPKPFREALTAANKATNSSLIRAIKLYKALNATLAAPRKLTGYHIETLAVEAAKGYDGPCTPRNLLMRFLDRSADRVLQPIGDVTGQSRHVDAHLGAANSNERRICSQSLLTIKRRLDAATSVGEWKALFGD